MFRPVISALAAAGIALATHAFSEDRMSKESYSSEQQRIDAEYGVDKRRCGALSGTARDVCLAEVNGKRSVARAAAEAALKGTDKAHYEALLARADSEYEVAKQKCDDKAGNDKAVCMKQAKVVYTKAKADARTHRTMT